MINEQDDDNDIKSDGSLRIPRAECTQDTFFHYLPKLSTRDLLCWALRTETSVRLAKINRESYSKTLNSNYLIDIYPTINGSGSDDSGLKGDATPKGHDEYKYSLKAHPQLSFMEKIKKENEDFSGLTPIIVKDKRRKKKRPRYNDYNDEDEYGYGGSSSSSDDDDDDDDEDDDEEDMKVFAGRQMVPPTMLHFEIILEAFMGYNLSAGANYSFYNSPNSSLPRGAIMGGAVVAALTSYQDKTVVEAFDNSNIFNEEGNLQEDSIYWAAKAALIKTLHNHFVYHKEGPLCSEYSKMKHLGNREAVIFPPYHWTLSSN